MSQEKVLETLKCLGLTKSDAQVYIFLGKKGPQKAKDISKSLKIPRQTLYLTIKKLQSKGIITATLEHPAIFNTVPFERVLDLFVKAKTQEIQHIKAGKRDLLADWQSIAIAESGDQKPKFTLIEGRNFIYSRLKQMIEETENQLSFVSTVSGLIRANEFGLLDAAFSRASKTEMKFRFLTELNEKNLQAVKLLLKKRPKVRHSFEGKTPELGLKLFSRIVIKDDVEAAFFISRDTDKAAGEADDVCLWTNSRTLVNSFKAVFEDLWQNSSEIENRILEIETGRPTPKTLVIRDMEEVKKKYYATIATAEREITIMTSSQGLGEVLKSAAQWKEKAAEGVSIKIMAPITRDNLQFALQLPEFCKVRHVATSYLNTTVIDRKHLFQFRNLASNQKTPDDSSIFENTFYTNDSEYVEKTSSMLDAVWESSYTPSAVTIEDITKPMMPAIAPVPDDEFSASRKDGSSQKMIIGIEEKPRLVTEEYVLNKMINAKRLPVRDLIKDEARFYGSWATAVFHPPAHFNLPDMMILVIHTNKQSSFGAGDSVQVHAWLETPKGHAYVPVAAITDNPQGMAWTRARFAGTPAAQNCCLVSKDALQIQVHGNTVFAGWTVPITLFPPKYVLPPACLLVEGYGKLKTSVINMSMPSGSTTVIESNGFDAFATFFHPASKYAGPGKEATISRDLILTVYPPSALKSSKWPQ